MNSLLGFVVILAFAGLASSDGPRQLDELRIVKGTLVGAHERPYQVLLREHVISKRQGKPKVCSGILVAERWVLTTALCKETFGRKSWSMVIGSTKWCDGGTYENFTDAYNDGASVAYGCKSRYQLNATRGIPYLVMVKFVFGRLQGPAPPLAKLSFELPKEGDMLEVSGWGKLSGSFPECDMRKATVPVVSNEECRKSYAGYPMYGTEFCAGYNENKKLSYYSRDEGSPLVKDGKVYGLITIVRPNRKPGSPSLYLPFGPYKEWIELFTSGEIDYFAQSFAMDCRGK